MRLLVTTFTLTAALVALVLGILYLAAADYAPVSRRISPPDADALTPGSVSAGGDDRAGGVGGGASGRGVMLCALGALGLATAVLVAFGGLARLTLLLSLALVALHGGLYLLDRGLALRGVAMGAQIVAALGCYWLLRRGQTGVHDRPGNVSAADGLTEGARTE